MKNCISLFIVSILVNIAVCAQSFTDYTALTTPHQYAGKILYLNNEFKSEIVDIHSVIHDTSLLRSFPNLVSNVTIYESNSKGELSVKVGLSKKKTSYEVIYDFTQSQTIVDSSTGNETSLLVGVGVRMVAKLRTDKAGLNLGSLIGLVADLDKVQGSIEVRVTGVGSRKINDIIPTPSDLSPSSIATALQAVATIKSLIYNSDTIITPQILAYSKLDTSIKSEMLFKAIN